MALKGGHCLETKERERGELLEGVFAVKTRRSRSPGVQRLHVSRLSTHGGVEGDVGPSGNPRTQPWNVIEKKVSWVKGIWALWLVGVPINTHVPNRNSGGAHGKQSLRPGKTLPTYGNLPERFREGRSDSSRLFSLIMSKPGIKRKWWHTIMGKNHSCTLLV